MRAGFLLLLIAVASLAAPVAAQPAAPDTAARRAFERGKALAAASKFDDAYTAFAEAYRVQPLPAFLFNMGEVARRGGQTEAARVAYQRYLEAEPTGAMADTARARLAALGPPAPKPPAVTPAPSPAVPPVPRPVLRPEPDPASRLTVMTMPPPRKRASRWPVWAAIGGGVVLAGVATGLYFALRTDDCDGCVVIR
ncbi:MAG: hypothetical protein IPH44_37680 [Myxococcales bacterium]|nr:hypothetical protein [Myxococcales bacterium]MBK7190873.1 hypothetical protein [Myxococcales bacterium]MBP6842816.1 hypothetical protein [Kofleriaceae bacterium]